jgi:hypothetical protein
MNGVLWQVDKSDFALSPVDQARKAIAAVAARHGRRPTFVQVRPGEWPEEIDGARVIPSPRMSYATLMMLGWGEAA